MKKDIIVGKVKDGESEKVKDASGWRIKGVSGWFKDTDWIKKKLLS